MVAIVRAGRAQHQYRQRPGRAKEKIMPITVEEFVDAYPILFHVSLAKCPSVRPRGSGSDVNLISQEGQRTGLRQLKPLADS